MAVVMWVVAGALVGWLAGRRAPARLPGGIFAYSLGGMAGGFLGGGTLVLVTDRNAGTVDPLGAVVAVAGAAVLVLIVRKAANTEPRVGAR
jgi:uncharacterized membrane protein YeaQ/YmgE (transglycosylase-associated protein family)